METSINDLDPHTLTHILFYVDPTFKGHISAVCRKWRRYHMKKEMLRQYEIFSAYTPSTSLYACEIGSMELLARALVCYPHPDPISLLLEAVYRGNVDCVRFLIRKYDFRIGFAFLDLVFSKIKSLKMTIKKEMSYRECILLCLSSYDDFYLFTICLGGEIIRCGFVGVLSPIIDLLYRENRAGANAVVRSLEYKYTKKREQVIGAESPLFLPGHRK